MIPIDWTDDGFLYDPTEDRYNRPVLGAPHAVKCVFVQEIGEVHGDHADQRTGDSRLLLNPDDEWLQSRGLRVEGLVFLANPYGADDDQQFFRITSGTPQADKLLGNEVQHISCTLQKVAQKEVAAS